MTASAAESTDNKKLYKKKSQAKVIFTRYCRSKLAVFGLVVFSLMFLFFMTADLFFDYETDALEMHIAERYQPPSSEHILGTDSYGRDMFARIVYGGRTSLLIGVATAAFALVMGTIIGASAAYFGGAVDNILMRIMDIFLAIPGTLLAIAIISVMDSSIFNLLIAMGISQTPRMSRLVRSAVLGVMGSDYIEAAKAVGTSHFRIIFRHILPNAMGPILVQTDRKSVV